MPRMPTGLSGWCSNSRTNQALAKPSANGDPRPRRSQHQLCNQYAKARDVSSGRGRRSRSCRSAIRSGKRAAQTAEKGRQPPTISAIQRTKRARSKRPFVPECVRVEPSAGTGVDHYVFFFAAFATGFSLIWTCPDSVRRASKAPAFSTRSLSLA